MPSTPCLLASLCGHSRALWGPLKHKLQVCSNLQGRVKQMPLLKQWQGSLPAERGLGYGLYPGWGHLLPLKPSCSSGR